MFGMGYGLGHGFIGVIGALVYALFALLVLVVVVGLIFLLVRFLLVATRAAQLYVAEHEPARPVAPACCTPAAPAAATSRVGLG